MAKPIRLTDYERTLLNADQKADAFRLQQIKQRTASALEVLDPDLPRETRERKAKKITDAAAAETAPIVQRMRERREMAEAQAPQYSTSTVLRRASLAAPPGLQHRLSRATDHELQAFAEDAVAENNLVLAGVIQAELMGRTFADTTIPRAVGTVLEGLVFPERAQAEPQLREIRDLALTGEMAAREASGTSDPVFNLTAAHTMDQPVLPA